MSEAGEFTEKYDEEDVFLQDENGVEQFPRPLHLDEVFEDVRMWQVEHQDHIFSSHREANLYMQRVVRNFDTNVLSKSMLGRPVVLSGTSIEVPHATYNEVTGRFIMEPTGVDQLPSGVSMGIAVYGLKGEFAGFGYRLNPAGKSMGSDTQTDADDAFTGSLLYQVATGYVSHAHGYTQFFATGNVLDTHVEFDDDVQKQKIDSILERLLSVESFATAEMINDLNIMLSERDKLAEHLPQIAGVVKSLTESVDFKKDIIKRDILLDLVTHYINPQGIYTFAATDVLVAAKGRRRCKIRPVDDPMIFNEQKVNGIILGSAYRRDEDKIIMSRKQYVPYFVLQKANQIVHVPMDRISKFAVAE